MKKYILAALAILVVVAIAFFVLRGDDDSKQTGSVTEAAKPAPRVSGRDRDLRAPGFDILVDDDSIGNLRMEGQVIDGDDMPVAGAEVTISSAPSRTVLTEEDGSFAFDKLVGRPYRIAARTKTGAAGPVTARLTATSDPVVLRLRPAASVEVTVLASDSREPLANAAVELRGLLTSTASTDSEGTAKLTGVASGFYQVAAMAPGYAMATTRLRIRGADASYKIELLARRGAPVSGIVRDNSGAPVEGAQVLYRSASDRSLRAHPRFDAAITGADGTFAFVALPSGTFRFTARHKQYAPGESEPITLSGTSETTNIEIVVEQGAILAGRVVTEDGEPAAFAAVRVSTAGGRRSWARPRQVFTREDGEFEITGLARKAVKIVALHERATTETHEADLEAEPVQRDLELVLSLNGVIAGVVVDSKGEPVDGAQVRLRPDFMSREFSFSEMRLRGIATDVSDTSGRFEFRGLADMTFFVQASPPGSRMRRRGMRGGDDAIEAKIGDTEIRVVLEARGSIVGKVAFADGSPVTTFSISMGGFRGGATPFASKDGSFRLSDLEPGNHRPRLTGGDFDIAQFPPTEVEAGQEVDVGTITVSRGRKVSGLVVSSSGQPVANATVLAGRSVRGSGSSSSGGGFRGMMSAVKTATTNEDGEFTISGLGPTSLAIVAEHEIHGRSATLALAATTESAIGLQLPLLAPGVVEGTVLLDGQPAESTRVTAQSQNVPSATFSVRTGSDGKYRFDILAPDQYLISARVGDPRSGFATSSRATTVESGTTASVDLAIVRGKVTLVVSAIGEGVNFAIVYVIEGPFAATNAQALEAKLANRDSGFSSMSIVFGGEPAWVENLLPAQYTVCALAFPEEIVGRAMFEYLGREAERLPVVCKDTAVAASPKEQEISIDVIVPTFVPITPIEPQQ